jgi:hypothetical protein
VKNIVKVFIITAGLVLSLNVNSFALVDGAVWGGYGFSGEVEGNTDLDPKSADYGVKAHYNTSLVPLLELGLGGYYQYTKIKFDLTGTDDWTRNSAGFDGNLILSLPIVHPYLRGTYAFWDKLKIGDVTDTEKFKAFGYGGGIEFTVFPFLRVFGEYMFEKTDHDGYLKMNTVNFGLKADI